MITIPLLWLCYIEPCKPFIPKVLRKLDAACIDTITALLNVMYSSALSLFIGGFIQ